MTFFFGKHQFMQLNFNLVYFITFMLWVIDGQSVTSKVGDEEVRLVTAAPH